MAKIQRLLLAAAALAAGAHAASVNRHAVDRSSVNRFETRLSPELKIRQAIDRLTFGARPDDFEQVRRMGLQKWIELQLHPERIPENPLLETRLKPLESLTLDSAEILRQYFPQFPPGFIRPTPLNDLLPGDQLRQVFGGTAEERRTAIMALDPEKRMKVLAVVGDNVVEG
ncbi:MAG TPA: DUF1800 family protein, partial [Bryobacteraceae bacterium]|nr:DUF1800 family protein [Bryobacteraceae bacterium]